MYLHVLRHAERSAFRQRSGVWDQQWAETRARCWDDELTERGKEQAREAARQLLADYGQPRRLVCSPFVRCVETALALADELGGGIRVEIDAGLCENMRTEWFGTSGPFDEIMLTLDQLRDKGFDVHKAELFGADSTPTAYEDEAHDDLHRPRRLAQCIRDRADEFAGCVLMTHGGIGHQLVRHLVPNHQGHLGYLDYAARSTVEMARDESDGTTRFKLVRPFEAPLRFTPDQRWMANHVPLWRELLHLPKPQDGSKLQLLELGSWEGLSATFWLQHFPKSHLTLADHFDLFNDDAAVRALGQARRERLEWNLHLTGHFEAVRVLPLFTHTALTRHLLPERRVFDFIYVDADHTTVGVLQDLVLAWPCLRQGGLLLIDDYEWPCREDNPNAPAYLPPTRQHADHPKRGIDAFLDTHREQLELVHKGYQVLVRKTAAQSFPFPEESQEQQNDQLQEPSQAQSSQKQQSVQSVQSSRPLQQQPHQQQQQQTPDAASGTDASSSSAAVGTVAAPDGVVAVLLPLTSRGGSRDSLRERLIEFERCLPPPDSCAIFVGVDDDDDVLKGEAGAELLREVFAAYWAAERVQLRFFPPASPSRICHIAATLARHAYAGLRQDGSVGGVHCDYFVLLGDDVRIEPQRTWLSAVRQSFDLIHERTQVRFGAASVPLGFGVVALPDATFAGFPTFPVVGRCHLDIFDSEVWPSLFINQDADPYLWALYRPFEARLFADGVRLENLVGGDEANGSARYDRQHVPWKDEVLREGIERIERWLVGRLQAPQPSDAPSLSSVSNGVEAADDSSLQLIRSQMLVTLDVIVPTFRGLRSILHGILSLPVPHDVADVAFIVIVDDPAHTSLRAELEVAFSAHRQILVRVNASNMGASASRNAGLDQATAQWTLFLDDDVEPHPWLLHRYVDAIRAHGHEAGGFVGLSCLPEPCTYLSAGLTMSYLSYFWRVAELAPGGAEAPWGVTANVLSRRGKARFDLSFLKTGGGEDILYLRHVVAEHGLPLLKAPLASVSHPWWDRAQPHPRRFYRWAVSDSLLMEEDMQPQHAFYSAPHAVECTLLLITLLPALLLASGSGSAATVVWRLLVCLSALWLTEAAFFMHKLLLVDQSVAGGVRGWRRVVCALLACAYTASCETGHTLAPLRRGSLYLFAKRVDWWYGLHPDFKREKRATENKRAFFFAVAVAASFAMDTCGFQWLSSGLVWLAASLAAGVGTLFACPPPSNPVSEDRVPQKNLVPNSDAADGVGVMHVAFISDGAYVPALAVAIRSLLAHHDDPSLHVHIHVVDVGIADEDWDLIAEMCSGYHVHLHRRSVDRAALSLHYPSRIRNDFPLWCKLWLDVCLPQELNAVIYLDCDVLVRGSLVPLWQRLHSDASLTLPDGGSAPLLAVRDAGVPCGESQLSMFGWQTHGRSADHYFNAGVLAIRLDRWRELLLGECLRSFARSFGSSSSLVHADQDVLNLVLRGRWTALPVEYNVQGMGTYGDDRARSAAGADPSVECAGLGGNATAASLRPTHRPQLYSPSQWSAIERGAVVVHFTGSALPPLSAALSPFVRAPSKPWSWFCYHPLRQQWYQALRSTPFAGRFPEDGADPELVAQLSHAIRDDWDRLPQCVPTVTTKAVHAAARAALHLHPSEPLTAKPANVAAV